MKAGQLQEVGAPRSEVTAKSAMRSVRYQGYMRAVYLWAPGSSMATTA